MHHAVMVQKKYQLDLNTTATLQMEADNAVDLDQGRTRVAFGHKISRMYLLPSYVHHYEMDLFIVHMVAYKCQNR